jgi:hypothetical protein
MTVTVEPVAGDQSYLASYLVGTYLFGSVIPPDMASGAPFSGTYEIYGDIGSMVFPAVVGPTGPPGPSAFALNLVADMSIDDPSDLPETLTNTPADIGKFWLLDDVDSQGDIIGASAYVWYGTSWRRVMLGTPGPPGPCPIITPTVTLIPPDQDSTIDTGGTPLEPTWQLNLAVPAGPAGPAAALAVCPDVDLLTNPPVAGDILGFTGRYTTGDPSYPIWVPVSISQFINGPYSMPEAAFTSFSGISSRAAIGSFAIPPQPFAWTPVVWGHLGAFGLELSADPLQIGAEVRLGDPTAGTLVGRGFGNTLGEVNVMPHYSDPNNTGVAITPENGLAVVPANHSNPAEGTLYFNLYNDGDVGLYQFSPTDAQGFVMVVPVAESASTGSAAVATARRPQRRRR